MSSNPSKSLKMESDEQNRPQRKAGVEIENGSGLRYRQKKQENAFNAAVNSSGETVVNEVINGFNNDKLQELKKRKYFESFPPGYRFCPEDSELIVHYLNKKVRLEELPPNKFQEVNLYQYNPEQLIANHPIEGEKEKEWYFLTPRDRKYKNGTRPNRAAGDGYWKATGADKSIIDNGIIIGFRKALVFYKGKPPNGDKTDWIMHEFRVNEPPRTKSGANDMRLNDCVLCRVYEKEKSKNDGDGKPTGNVLGNVHKKEETYQHVHGNEFEKINVDYNSLLRDSNGYIYRNDDYFQLQHQKGSPQEVPQYVAPISATNFCSLPLIQPMSIDYEALQMKYGPSCMQSTKNTLMSECLNDEKTVRTQEDVWINLNLGDIGSGSKFNFSSIFDMDPYSSLDCIFPDNTQEDPLN